MGLSWRDKYKKLLNPRFANFFVGNNFVPNPSGNVVSFRPIDIDYFRRNYYPEYKHKNENHSSNIVFLPRGWEVMDEKKDLVAFYNDLIEHVIRHADQEDDVLELFSDFFRYEQFRHGLRNEMVTINTYYFTPEEYRAICTILINQINRLLEKHKLRFDYEISDCEFRLTRLVKVNHVKVNIPEKTRVRTVIDQAEQALESAFYDQIPGLIGKALEVQLKSVFKKHHLTLKDNDGKMKAIDAIQNPNLKSLGNLLEEFKNQKFHEDSERNNEIHRLVNALEEPLKISNFIRPIWGMRCNVSVHPSVDDENERKNQLSVLKRHHAELILNAGITLSNFIYECFLANDDNEATLSAHPQSK